MALELNAECDICGKKYHVCHTCSEVMSFKPWRTVTDTMEHYKIYLAIAGYTNNKDKTRAKELLLKCDLTELESFNENIRNAIKEIMSDDEKLKTTNISTKNNCNKGKSRLNSDK